MNNIDQYIYSDQNKTKNEKIFAEKRRRNQIYQLLDHNLSNVSYFDFFSKDAFALVIKGLYLTQAVNKETISPEVLLLTFLNPTFEFSSLLKEYGINETETGTLISSSNKINPKSFSEKRDYFVYRLFKKFLNISLFEQFFVNFDVKISHESNLMFEKAAENALVRFKTPVITPEILFVTMMEQKNNKVGKIIKKFLKNDTNWYLLRYKLIKRLHYQETDIRTNVSKNNHYFVYLLKLNLSEYEFNRLIETESLNLGVSVFRNRLISQLLKVDIFNQLENEIHKSIKVSNKRNYSS
jgi:hypothetical protein